MKAVKSGNGVFYLSATVLSLGLIVFLYKQFLSIIPQLGDVSGEVTAFVENAAIFSAKAIVIDFKEEKKQTVSARGSGQMLVPVRLSAKGITPSAISSDIDGEQPEQSKPDKNAAQLIEFNILDFDETHGFAANTDKDGIITKQTYTGNAGYFKLDGGGQIQNLTTLSYDEIAEITSKLPAIKPELGAEPQVLIMHTHATEAYQMSNVDFYDKDNPSRTLDPEISVVAVGDRIAGELVAAGISVVHDGTVHDDPSYNGSYERSRVAVQKMLEQYPTIKIVLDIHRDAVELESGERIAPTTEINGEKAAQIMIIAGCDDGTMDMPDYDENLKLAAMLQSTIEGEFPTLTRPILFDYRKYNQDLTTGSLLIEVGGHANTLDEALYSGELVGKALAKALLSLVGD